MNVMNMMNLTNIVVCIIFILFYDVWFYVSHIIMHRNKMLHSIHSEHHSEKKPCFLDTYRAHWFETVFQGIGLLVPAFLIEYSWAQAFLVFAFLNIRGMMRHDDRCSFITGPHHLMHHKHPSYNFGEYWIDRLCGTLLPDRVGVM